MGKRFADTEFPWGERGEGSTQNYLFYFKQWRPVYTIWVAGGTAILADPEKRDILAPCTGEHAHRLGSCCSGLSGAVEGSSSPRFSRKVTDGAKNRLPVTARLKSRSRS